MAATTIRELGARHGLLNLSVYDLVEDSNLSTTTRCANSSGLSRSSSCNYLRRNYGLRLSCLIRLRY
ncbi:hypothetical protein HBH70_143250 [Parastagonospora nodorum]|nr:hypothetical protein HBH70_143250 [Parastagonospora nodorum]